MKSPSNRLPSAFHQMASFLSISSSRFVLHKSRWARLLCFAFLSFGYLSNMFIVKATAVETTVISTPQKRANLERLRVAAESGDASAMGQLGLTYFEGDKEGGIAIDDAKAFKWLESGASKGDSTSLFGLGRCYSTGCGVKKDHEMASNLYEKSIAAGNKQAYLFLGLNYFRKDDASSWKHAALLFQEGAKYRDLECMACLGACYFYGRGVSSNSSIAAELLQQALAGDLFYSSAMAKFVMGALYEEGWGIKMDEAKAFELYKDAASEGWHMAMLAVGDCYLLGKGAPKDEKKAYYSYSRALKLEPTDPATLFAVGRCYLFGIGVAKDQRTAINLLKQSEKGGWIAARDALQNIEDQKKAAAARAVQQGLEILGALFSGSSGSRPDEGYVDRAAFERDTLRKDRMQRFGSPN